MKKPFSPNDRHMRYVEFGKTAKKKHIYYSRFYNKIKIGLDRFITRPSHFCLYCFFCFSLSETFLYLFDSCESQIFLMFLIGFCVIVVGIFIMAEIKIINICGIQRRIDCS